MVAGLHGGRRQRSAEAKMVRSSTIQFPFRREALFESCFFFSPPRSFGEVLGGMPEVKTRRLALGLRSEWLV